MGGLWCVVVGAGGALIKCRERAAGGRVGGWGFAVLPCSCPTPNQAAPIHPPTHPSPVPPPQRGRQGRGLPGARHRLPPHVWDVCHRRGRRRRQRVGRGEQEAAVPGEGDGDDGDWGWRWWWWAWAWWWWRWAWGARRSAAEVKKEPSLAWYAADAHQINVGPPSPLQPHPPPPPPCDRPTPRSPPTPPASPPSHSAATAPSSQPPPATATSAARRRRHPQIRSTSARWRMSRCGQSPGRRRLD